MAKKKLKQIAYNSRIVEITAEVFKADISLVMSRSRKGKTVEARQVAMYIMCKALDMTLKMTGEHFGRDHSTVHSAIKTVRDRAETEIDYCSKLERIAALLGSEKVREVVRELARLNKKFNN